MDLRVSDQAAFLLHRREYQESSLILEIFTRDYGRISLLAKAARKRRDVSHFQIARRLHLGWSGKSNLKTLTAIDSQGLSVPEACHIPVFYLNELLLYLLPEQDVHSDLFDLYQLTLIQMNNESLEPLLRTFELKLLQSLGLMPDLAVDTLTGKGVEIDLDYRLEHQSGLQLARKDERPSYSGLELLAIQDCRFDSPSILIAAKALMRSIIDFNLQGRKLQSRQFYYQMIKSKKAKSQ